MSKQKKVVKLLNVLTTRDLEQESLEAFAKFFSGMDTSEEVRKVVAENDSRVFSAGDVMTLVNFLVEDKAEETAKTTAMLMDKISVLENIVVDKLEVTDEEFSEYLEKYKNRKAELINAFLEEQKKQSEEATADGEE